MSTTRPHGAGSITALAMLLAGLLLFAWPEGASAQSAVTRSGVYGVQYRPSDVAYRVGRYPHFDVIYQQETERTAFQVATELEDHRRATNRLVGRPGARMQMPVVINGYNDRSNGFVSPLPFRQEIEAPSIKRDALTAYFPSWPAAVAPHELVHAAHAEINAGVGVGGLVRLFGPDVSRIINLMAPRGLLEGVAVYRESQLHAGAGRLHVPVATMKYRAAMLSNDPWSLTQMLEAPSYTRPFDRHYLGGGQLFAYLAAEEDSTSSPAFFRRATRLHHRFPFLGFGMGLWYGTGASPTALNRKMQAALVADEQARQAARAPFSSYTVISGADGLEYRRPHWTNDSTLVVHAAGYNVRPGFYAVDARSGARTLLSPQQHTEDAAVSIARDSTALYFSRYVPDPLVATQWRAEVHRLTLADGAVEQQTIGGRAHAPVEAPDGRLWALPNDGAYNQWGIVQPDGTVEPITALHDVRIKQVAPAPDGSTVAVLMNVDGVLQIYQATNPDGEISPQMEPWIGFNKGAIYDVNWGPQGRYLLFSADPDGTVNIYALDTVTGAVTKQTHVPLGAMEPTLSPDGTTLAFVNYQHERFDVVRMPFCPEAAEPVASSAVESAQVLNGRVPDTRHSEVDSIRTPASTRPYAPVRYLAPRLVHPTFHYNVEQRGGPLGVQVGTRVAGADPLQKWAYMGGVFYQAHRLWGHAQVQTGRYLLRPRLSVYNTPHASGSVGIEERGAALQIELPITQARNVHLTQVQFQLRSALEQARAIDDGGQVLSDFSTRWTLRPGVAWGYRLERNLRDLVPNRGLILQSTAEVDLWNSGPARRGWQSSARVYLPLLTGSNTGVSVYARLLTQNRASVLSADPLLPRGHAGRGLPAGTFGTMGTEVVQPLTFIDDGFTTVPFYFKSLYAYGFAETMRVWGRAGLAYSAVGTGLGLQSRFFYVLDLDLRIGMAFDPGARDVRTVYR